ncbi:hypothetical protein AXG93_590s1030 [Marchantia polymorpha subsp. ruderalis]|uniref:Uncharacterized protein n=1 Tax=Marchantia polymorpha subsp. ruderalis TaxID=1480154 RepID=A0A176VUM9_MARPO|nr:hypothetical protein AXG93_590s1030 [Marchantia polymorpha subsp. ruderalis]
MSARLATSPQTKSDFVVFVFAESLIDGDAIDAAMELVTVELDETKECKRGRSTSTVWTLFTNDAYPQNAKRLFTSKKQEFQKQMAMQYFATCTSFQKIGDIHLVEAVKVLRFDDGLLPTHQLATSLLDKSHEDLKAKVNARMRVFTGQQGHDHKFLASDVERVFKTYEITTFVGALTDNTSTNKKAWTVLRAKFSSRFF